MWRNRVTKSHNMRVLCRTGRDSEFRELRTVVPPVLISHCPYRLSAGAEQADKDRDGFRDNRSTHGEQPTGQVVAAWSVRSPQLGPGYRLLYSPVGKPPASFRSIEAATSGGPLAFW